MDVSKEAKEKALEKIKENIDPNGSIVFITRHSNHPDDSSSYNVMAECPKKDDLKNGNKYCVWEFNINGGLYYGHYGLSFQVAMQAFAEKLYDCRNF